MEKNGLFELLKEMQNYESSDHEITISQLKLCCEYVKKNMDEDKLAEAVYSIYMLGYAQMIYSSNNSGVAERLREFENSDRGKRFIKSVMTAKEFRQKHDRLGGIPADQFYYFCDKAIVKDTCDAIYEAFNYAYRRGYNAAKKEQKSRR